MVAHGRSRWRTAVAPFALAVLAAASAAGCTTAVGGKTVDGQDGRGTYKVGMLADDPGGEPAKGGTLTFAAYSEAALLDPAETIVSGATGGVEMAAVYDVLMRWDSRTGTLVPQLAKGLESSADQRTWTLTLRDGVTFSDGSPLDAAAVKWSLERYVEKGADEAKLWAGNVTEVEARDDSTVVFRLARKWPGFGHMLTTGPGMIVARSADAGEKFAPVGAGPFAFGRYKPREELVLNARAGYWGGKPNLDKVRVVFVNDPNAVLDSLDSGATQAAFLRDPAVVDDALAAKYRGFMNLVSLGSVGIINASKGRPGADPRVRQAMAQAIEPRLVSRRAYQGAGVASGSVFPEFSNWHTGIEPLPYDPAKARELVRRAKADGYDGRVTYMDSQDPASRATALTVKALLENVGFKVEVDLVRSVADQISKVAVKRDYDVAGWGISWREAGPYARMFATLHSKGNATVGMPTGPQMDALIDAFQGAGTPAEQRALTGRIQQQWNKDVPALIFGPTPELVAWPATVRGVEGSANSMILLGDAWLAPSG